MSESRKAYVKWREDRGICIGDDPIPVTEIWDAAWQAAQAQAGEAVGEVFVDDSYFGNGQVNANIYFGIILPHGTKLYTRPQPAQAVIAVQQDAQVNQQLLDKETLCALFNHYHALAYNPKSEHYRAEHFYKAAIAAAQEQSNSRPAKGEK